MTSALVLTIAAISLAAMVSIANDTPADMPLPRYLTDTTERECDH